jgi:hypothetical protein
MPVFLYPAYTFRIYCSVIFCYRPGFFYKIIVIVINKHTQSRLGKSMPRLLLFQHILSDIQSTLYNITILILRLLYGKYQRF